MTLHAIFVQCSVLLTFLSNNVVWHPIVSVNVCFKHFVAHSTDAFSVSHSSSLYEFTFLLLLWGLYFFEKIFKRIRHSYPFRFFLSYTKGNSMQNMILCTRESIVFTLHLCVKSKRTTTTQRYVAQCIVHRNILIQ